MKEQIGLNFVVNKLLIVHLRLTYETSMLKFLSYKVMINSEQHVTAKKQ